MIILDMDKYIESIFNNGISANDTLARQKLNDVFMDLINNTTYKKKQIIDKVKAVAQDYFYGLPDDIINSQLSQMYAENKAKEYKPNEKKILTLYESEMRTIAAIKDDKLRRLAFSALVYHKFCGQYEDGNGDIAYHTSVLDCAADIFRTAGLDNISGTARNKMLKTLSDMGIIKFYVKTNTAYRFDSSWIAITLFTIPINVDVHKEKLREKVFMRMTNYDDVLLYLRYYLGDKDIILCADCGCPIVKTGNKKQLCADCAERRKSISDNARKYKKVS